jgi:hypothetical protein
VTSRVYIDMLKKVLHVASLDLSAMSSLQETEQFIYVRTEALRSSVLNAAKNNLPLNVSHVLIYTGKRHPCFTQHALYMHTNSNSRQLVLTLLMKLLRPPQVGYMFELGEEDHYDLSTVLIIDSVYGMAGAEKSQTSWCSSGRRSNESPATRCCSCLCISSPTCSTRPLLSLTSTSRVLNMH